MKRNKVQWLVPALAAVMLAGAGLWGSSAEATVMVELTLEDMARDAVAIVHGRVVRSSGHLDLSDGKPYTISTLEVQEWIKGSGGDTVAIRELGGEFGRGGRGGIGINGVPDYVVGEEVIVFLEEDDGGDFYRTYGMVQGKFVVRLALPDHPVTVVRDAEAIAFARWSDGQMILDEGNVRVMALETFRNAILQALAYAPPRVDTGRTDEVNR